MLETIWFLLWGLLWAIYFMLDGFDLGLGVLLPHFGKTDTERRVIYNSMGPFWDANEVWLITAGGVTFAAFPAAYATLFSAFYTPLMLLLFGLILRGISFEFRSKRENPLWRSFWDWCAAVGSFLPALLLGVAFANIFKGIPIDGEGVFQGTIFTLLNPYGLAGGLFFLSFFLMHGSLWLAIKAEGLLQERAAAAAKRFWLSTLVLAVLFLVMTAFSTKLYLNYLGNPVLLVVPLVAVAALLATRLQIAKGGWWKAWFASSLTIVAVTLFGVIGLYPNLLPSSLDPSFSVTVWNGSSSPLTLKIMLGVALIFVPIVIIYQTWVYRLFREKLREDDVQHDEAY
jgi:cytochrome bd ubiquinol oxidase subunit II